MMLGYWRNEEATKNHERVKQSSGFRFCNRGAEAFEKV